MIGSLRLVVAAGLAMLATCPPAAAEVAGEILDWGITSGFRDPPPDRAGPGETGLAPVRAMRQVRYEERTDTIEARLCRSFGMKVRLRRTEGGAPPRVEVRVTHPTFTRPDGATSTEDRFPSDVTGDVTHVGFGFDHPWELESGPWSIAVYVRGVEVARRAFNVVAPPAGAPRSECLPETTS